MCVCFDLQCSHFGLLALYCGLLASYTLVGTTSPFIPSFESCNSLDGLSGPCLVSFPWGLSSLHLPEVLTRGVLSTWRGETGTSRALDFAYAHGRYLWSVCRHAILLTPDPSSVGSWWHQGSVRGIPIRTPRWVLNHLKHSAFSGAILLPDSVKLPTSLILQLGLQQGPPKLSDNPSELRIGSSIPISSALYLVGDPATVSLRPSFESAAVDFTSWSPRYSGVMSSHRVRT